MINAAKTLYADEDKQQHMVTDLKLLLKGFKLCAPLLIMFILGLSFSLISVILELTLSYFFYTIVIDYYKELRNHNMTRKAADLDGNPETEISTFFKVCCREVTATIRSVCTD